MRAEIISVGTELLLGHTVNTDAAHVGRALSALGVDLLQVHTVGDNAGRLEAALREALNCADVVITTGGLGPTDDDMTKETVARVLDAPLEEHEDSLRRLREYFGSRPIGANQLKQAWLPRGSTAFPNNAGTAPGCAVPAKPGQWVILLPGPPSELLPMLEDSVMPFLQHMGGSVIASFMVRTFGIGEGTAALRIGDLTEGANPTVAPYAGDAEMFVRVTAKAENAAAAKELATPVVEAVRERLGDVVYGVNVSGLESVVVEELRKRGQSLATAESCTGGLLAKRITDQPGASEVFGYGLITYANEAKTRLLGVPQGMLARYGAVSPQVARK
ncbi:CinA family nicotinamide mononucleotide deamidase-related protein, partial [Desulfovibrio sp. 1188_IL3213]|uniref:CinA family nicotinamide mononucleotide deamidase-related protein n=1 Tax=Desulfovibrio sp. 1188_IL3213 TaxID=3084052 RepID=UPI002FD9B6BF